MCQVFVTQHVSSASGEASLAGRQALACICDSRCGRDRWQSSPDRLLPGPRHGCAACCVLDCHCARIPQPPRRPKSVHPMLQTGEDMKSKYKETSLGGRAVNVVEC